MSSGEGCLSEFNNSLAATNILVVGDNIGVAKSVGNNCAVAHILIPPVDVTKKYSNGSVQGPGLGNMFHHHELCNSHGGSDHCRVML